VTLEACIFCERLHAPGLLAENDLAGGFLAGFPVSPGHALIVPRRHEAEFFSLSPAEQTAMLALLGRVRAQIEDRFAPDAYNLGVNAGKAAGQTVLHTHLHVIPRYVGDVDEPRGGVRWVLPATARYW
jgi:diadenosine tetraphosphate (Ap4A) HIT family hydrolase